MLPFVSYLYLFSVECRTERGACQGMHEGAEKAHVIGVSFGGKIALDFTLAHPEVMTSLILVDPSIGGYPLVKGQTTLRIAYPTRQNTAFRYAVSGIAG